MEDQYTIIFHRTEWPQLPHRTDFFGKCGILKSQNQDGPQNVPSGPGCVAVGGRGGMVASAAASLYAISVTCLIDILRDRERDKERQNSSSRDRERESERKHLQRANGKDNLDVTSKFRLGGLALDYLGALVGVDVCMDT